MVSIPDRPGLRLSRFANLESLRSRLLRVFAGEVSAGTTPVSGKPNFSFRRGHPYRFPGAGAVLAVPITLPLLAESFSGFQDKTQVAVETSSAAEEIRGRAFAAWAADKPAASGVGTAAGTAAGKPAASGVGRPVAVLADTAGRGYFAGVDRPEAADRMDLVWFDAADTAFAVTEQSFGWGFVRFSPNRASDLRSLSRSD